MRDNSTIPFRWDILQSIESVQRYCMKKSASFLFVCVILLSAAFAQTPGYLSGWLVKEVSFDTESFLRTKNLDGFMPYDGGSIPRDTSLQSRKIMFVLDLYLVKPAPGTSLALLMGPGDYPCDVYFNDVLIGRTGSYGAHYASTIYYSSRFPIDSNLIREKNTLAVEAFPLSAVNPLPVMRIGDWKSVSSEVFWRNEFNVFLIQASFVFALILAAFFILLYFSGSRDLKYLYFAFVCIGYSMAYTNISLFNDSMNEIILEKISRCGFPLTSMFLVFFSVQFAQIRFKRKALTNVLRLALIAPVALVCVGTLLQKDKEAIMAFFGAWTTGIVLPLLLVLTIIALVIGLFERRDAASVVVLFAFSIIVATSVHDILILGTGVAPFAWLVPYGYTAFVLSIFFVLALDQAAVLKKIQSQALVMDAQHDALSNVVSDLTLVSEGLVSSSNILSRTMNDTIAVVETYGSENRAILADFGEEAKSVESEIEKIADRLSKTASRIPEAIANQTKSAKNVNASLKQLGEKISGSLGSVEQSNGFVRELASNADKSSRLVQDSRDALARVEKTSSMVRGVLIAIDDLSERTNVLSINAAIESARFGNAGKGFAVVAQEIRKLSIQSQSSLKASFEGIQEMSSAIAETIENHDAVERALEAIILKSHKAAEESNSITRLVNEQEAESREMGKNADRLIVETNTLETLSNEERLMNEDLKQRLSKMAGNFEKITQRLENQDGMKDTLFAAIEQMRSVMKVNAEHIDKLKFSSQRVQDANVLV